MITLPRSSSQRVCLVLFWFGCVGATATADQYSQVFRGRSFDPKLFRVIGSKAHQSITPSSVGLRITLAADHGNDLPVGLIGRPGVRGDFEITMSFRATRVDKPTSGNGAGVSIWISTTSNTREAAQIAWHHLPSGQQVFSAMRAFTPPEGKREFHGTSVASDGRAGKLRLVRTGSTLKCLAAGEGNSKFREVYETEFDTQDLEIVRFAVENGGSPTLVDARIESVTVESEKLASARMPPLPPGQSGWVVMGLFAVLLGVGYRFWWRHKRASDNVPRGT